MVKRKPDSGQRGLFFADEPAALERTPIAAQEGGEAAEPRQVYAPTQTDTVAATGGRSADLGPSACRPAAEGELSSASAPPAPAPLAKHNNTAGALAAGGTTMAPVAVLPSCHGVTAVLAAPPASPALAAPEHDFGPAFEELGYVFVGYVLHGGWQFAESPFAPVRDGSCLTCKASVNRRTGYCHDYYLMRDFQKGPNLSLADVREHSALKRTPTAAQEGGNAAEPRQVCVPRQSATAGAE